MASNATPLGNVPQEDKELQEALETLEKGSEDSASLAEALERLPQEIAPVSEPVTVPDLCQKCHTNPAHHTCVKCHGLTCPNCRSTVDPSYCNMCLTEAHINLRQEPLVDDEGVSHDGKHLFPEGSAFKTLPQIISEMTDKALAAYIDLMKLKVREAEKIIDYRRVALAAATLETEERAAVARRKRAGVKIVSASVQKIVAPGKSQKTSGVQPKLTLSPEMIQNFMAKLSPEARTKLQAEMDKLKAKEPKKG